jgi:LPXTG-site transpeptidase (sortase) family protein
MSDNNNLDPLSNENTQPNLADDKPDNLNAGPAIELIRAKLDSIYDEEPDVSTEEAEATAAVHRSRHQQFMYELMTSGKDLALIQTEWHNYYQKLSNKDKQQVWHEFYASNKNANIIHQQPDNTDQSTIASDNSPTKTVSSTKIAKHLNERALKLSGRGVAGKLQNGGADAAALRNSIRSSAVVSAPKLTWKHHLQSAAFGLACGLVVIFILLFSFFNQVVIAPFIQPSRNQTATPIILSNATIAPNSTPEVIIPKINVEIPVVYSVNTTNEAIIENNLEDGVVHFPTTSVPGQNGNAAFFGHSANNIFNPGKYKFAFVLLHDLVAGDVFYLTYNNTVYAYKVFTTEIVNPNDVSVLNPVPGHTATATLITCDPPGTSINRLVVIGDQISPSPAGNVSVPQAATAAAAQVSVLPSNGPSLWQRFISTTWGKIVSVVFVVGAIYLIWLWYTKLVT